LTFVLIRGHRSQKIALLTLLLSVVAMVTSCLKDNPISSQTQLREDTIAISNFLLQQNIVATKLPNGVWYVIDTPAIGFYPVLTDSIQISYEARLIPSLDKIDAVSRRNVLLSSVISGWQLTLPRFTVGSSGRLFVPSGLAFGATSYVPKNGVSNYPPNSNLLFYIKILGVIGTRLSSDVAAIDAYLGAAVVLKDPSGIRYSYDSSGFGKKPVLTDSIEVTYTGKILNADSTFANKSNAVVSLKDQVPAWKIILPKIKEGDSVTMYVPSGYGYGSAFVTPQIPANSNLQYNVTLIKVR